MNLQAIPSRNPASFDAVIKAAAGFGMAALASSNVLADVAFDVDLPLACEGVAALTGALVGMIVAISAKA